MGLDALFSMVQMPKGMPVACVGINRVDNAAILSAEIIGLKDKKVRDKIKKFREELRAESEGESALKKVGFLRELDEKEI